MPTEIITKSVPQQSGIDSTSSALPLLSLFNGQYSDFKFENIQVPNYFVSVDSIKLFYKREHTGNLYLKFRTEHVDTDAVSSTTVDADSLTAYGGGGTDGKIASITVPTAAYNGLTLDAGDILALKIERAADNALDTYETDFQIAFIQITFNATAAAAGANDIVLLAELKSYLRKTDTNQDNFLQDWITIVSGQIERYCDRKFREQTIADEIHDGDGTNQLYTHYFPITGLSGATDAAKLANLQDRNDPDSAWEDIETDIDHIFIDERRPYIELYDEIFASGRRNIRVSYVAGYATIPEDVKRVACEMCAIVWKESNAGNYNFRLGEGSYTNSIQGTNFTVSFIDLDKRWKMILDRYRKVVV